MLVLFHILVSRRSLLHDLFISRRLDEPSGRVGGRARRGEGEVGRSRLVEGARESHLRLAGLAGRAGRAGAEGSIIVLRLAAQVSGEGIGIVLRRKLAGLGDIHYCRLGFPPRVSGTAVVPETSEDSNDWNYCKPEIIPVKINRKIVSSNVHFPFSQII